MMRCQLESYRVLPEDVVVEVIVAGVGHQAAHTDRE